MAAELIITRLDELPFDRFAGMLAESESSGYRFLRRVADEWGCGVNRFSRPGEALLVAEKDGRWVGICGLGIDHYLGDPRVGRVRNVYVLADCRGAGIGRRLVAEAIARARGRFDRLRLRRRRRGAGEAVRVARLPPVSGHPGLHPHHGMVRLKWRSAGLPDVQRQRRRLNRPSRPSMSFPHDRDHEPGRES